jgi:hypothetical protein
MFSEWANKTWLRLKGLFKSSLFTASEAVKIGPPAKCLPES